MYGGTRRIESKTHKSVCITAICCSRSLDCLYMVPSFILPEHILVYCSNVGSPPPLPVLWDAAAIFDWAFSALSAIVPTSLSALLLQESWFTLFSRQMKFSTHTEPPATSGHYPHSPLIWNVSSTSTPVCTLFHGIFSNDTLPMNPELIAPHHNS